MQKGVCDKCVYNCVCVCVCEYDCAGVYAMKVRMAEANKCVFICTTHYPDQTP